MAEWSLWFGCAIAGAAMVYGILALLAVRAPIRSPGYVLDDAPAVTMLKPLCGAEPETYECLRSFCDQAYRDFQVVFGVKDGMDPAVAIVERLQREFPHRDLQLVIDRRQHGSSGKVSNLINMAAFARHDVLVISDSDIRVERDYLANVVAPLLDAGVGIVTCPYRGAPGSGFWSHMGSLFINEWFMPSVRVAAMAGSRSFGFGATIAMRRQALVNIGGFAAICDQLADDYRLGELTRRIGLRTVLSEVVVDTCVAERSLEELVRHELRWLRTIRLVRPLGFFFSFVTFGVPVAALGTLAAGGAAPAAGMLAVTAVARLLLHLRVREPGTSASALLVLPLRETLSLALWGWSFATRRVHWRDDRYQVGADGSVRRIVRI